MVKVRLCVQVIGLRTIIFFNQEKEGVQLIVNAALRRISC